MTQTGQTEIASARQAVRDELAKLGVNHTAEIADRIVAAALACWEPSGKEAPAAYRVTDNKAVCEVAQADRAISGPGVIAPELEPGAGTCVVHVDGLNRVYRVGVEHGRVIQRARPWESNEGTDNEMRTRVMHAIDKLGRVPLMCDKIDSVLGAIQHPDAAAGSRIRSLETELHVVKENYKALEAELETVRRERQHFKEMSYPFRVTQPAGMAAPRRGNAVLNVAPADLGPLVRSYLVHEPALGTTAPPALRGDDPADRLLARAVAFGRAAKRAMASNPSADRITDLATTYVALEMEVLWNDQSDQPRAERDARDHVGGFLHVGPKPMWSTVRDHLDPTGKTPHVLVERRMVERLAAIEQTATSLITAYDAWHDLERDGKPDDGQKLATSLCVAEGTLRDQLGMNRAIVAIAPGQQMRVERLPDKIGQALDRLRACKINAENWMEHERHECKKWHDLTARQAMRIDELEASQKDVRYVAPPGPGAPTISALVGDAVRSVIGERGLPLDEEKLGEFANAVGQRSHAWICDYRLHNPRGSES